MNLHRIVRIASLSALGLTASTATGQAGSTAGDPVRGRVAIEQHGCIACHTIPGIPNPGSEVGPPLARIGRRIYLAGALPNTPENMVRWLRDPAASAPRTLMPNTGLSEAEARDIAAYLYQSD